MCGGGSAATAPADASTPAAWPAGCHLAAAAEVRAVQRPVHQIHEGREKAGIDGRDRQAVDERLAVVQRREGEEEQRGDEQDALEHAVPRGRLDLADGLCLAPLGRRLFLTLAVATRVRSLELGRVDLPLAAFAVHVDVLVIVPQLFLPPASLLARWHRP